MNFQDSLEEFQILGIFAIPAVILIVLLEFAAALSFLTGKYMKQAGLVLALVIICATIGKFILNWSVYLKEFPKLFSFDDTVHNLIYHLTLILLGALIHKYINNGIIRFEAISMNNERSVPSVVRERRMRKKLTKDDIPLSG